MPNLLFEIMQNIACLGGEKIGWAKELNLISQNRNASKYDIRAWSNGHTKMGKGVTLTTEELTSLKNVLNELIIK